MTTSKQLPVVQYSNTQFSLRHKAHWKMEVFRSQMFSPLETRLSRGFTSCFEVLMAWCSLRGVPSLRRPWVSPVSWSEEGDRCIWASWRPGKFSKSLESQMGVLRKIIVTRFDGCRSRISAFGILAKIPVLLKGPSEVYCVTSTPGAARLKPVPQ